MQRLPLLLAVLLCTLLLCTAHQQGADALAAIPTFRFDYAKPPLDRWAGIVEHTILAAHPWEHSLGPFIRSYYTGYVSKLPAATLQLLEDQVSTRFSTTIFPELQGLAAQFAKLDATRYPEARLVNTTFLSALVWFHELAHASELSSSFASIASGCTGVLALPSDVTEEIRHARNLDQSSPQGRNCTVTVFYVDSSASSSATSSSGGDNEILFQSTDMYTVLTAGFVTAFRPRQPRGGAKRAHQQHQQPQEQQALSFEENWRFGSRPLQEIVGVIARRNSMPQVLMFRLFLEQHRHQKKQQNVMENKKLVRTTAATTADDFSHLVTFLNTSLFAAPFFGIVAGSGRQGAVVSVDFDLSKNRVELITDASPHWAIAQTNWARWKPDPPSSLGGPGRRTVAERTIRGVLGRAIGTSKMGMWQTISTWPVHNYDTEYSCVFDLSSTEPQPCFARKAMTPYEKKK